MQYIPLLAFFILIGGSTVGCATTSLEELTAEARECVTNTHSISDQGIVGDPTPEQKTACWADANKKLEMMAKREKQMEAEAAARCPGRLVAWCDTWGRCHCVSSAQSREALRRAGLYY